MCGICGIVERSGYGPDPDVLGRLNAKLLHRGPDDAGAWIDGSAGLAMRRLAIIDLAGGHQPMFNEDGSIAVVFNGEIYNYRDLRKDLEDAGHRLATHSDTEAIVHIYEQYGPEGLARLNGMFAIAVWDRHRRRGVLARDRAGKKPLSTRSRTADWSSAPNWLVCWSTQASRARWIPYRSTTTSASVTCRLLVLFIGMSSNLSLGTFYFGAPASFEPKAIGDYVRVRLSRDQSKTLQKSCWH